MLNARFESAEATFVAGTIWLEGAVLAFDSVCKIFEALIIKICVSCGSSSISDINLFHALHYAQPRSMRRLLLQGAFKLDCTPSLDKYFPPFVSVNHCYEAVLFCPSKPIFGEVDYVYLLSDGSSPLPWASIKVELSWVDLSESVLIISFVAAYIYGLPVDHGFLFMIPWKAIWFRHSNIAYRR